MSSTIKPGRGGRPSKLSEEVAQRIYKAICVGMTLENAARFAGVGESTLEAWKARGAKEKTGRYAEFLELVKRAESTRQAQWLHAIEKAVLGERSTRIRRKFDKQGNITEELEEPFWLMLPSWQAAAWKLERLYASEFGRQVPLVQQNNIQQNNQLTAAVADVRKLSDEEIKARLAELAEKRRKLREGDEPPDGNHSKQGIGGYDG